MITRLEVDGFKSLRDFAVDLEPFTALIGPNSAGKSNILDALALVSRLCSMPINEGFSRGRGRALDQFTRRGGDAVKTMRFAVEVLVHGTVRFPSREILSEEQNRFRYELTIERRVHRSGAEHLIVADERLRALRREDDAWIQAHPELASVADHRSGGGDVFFAQADDASGKRRVVGPPSPWPGEVVIPLTHTYLASDRYHANVRSVREALAGKLLLQLDGSRLREPSERVSSGELVSDASNLPTVLADLPAPALGEIRADLVSLVPGIASFDVLSEDGTFRIEFELSGGERMPARLVSDGTLRVLALLTALRTQPRPHIIGIEEPENGIYPGRLCALLERLREAASHFEVDFDALQSGAPESGAFLVTTNLLPTQVLLTTHSPVVLAALRAQPQHLRYVDTVRRDGERVTRVRSVGRPEAPDRGQRTISPREIDRILSEVRGEDAE